MENRKEMSKERMENWTKKDWLKAYAETRWTVYRPFTSLDCPNEAREGAGLISL